MTSSLVIVEASAAGHRLWYVRLLVEAALRELPDREVVLLVPREALTSEPWAVHLAGLSDQFVVRTEPAAVPDWRGWALGSLRADPPQRLVVPDADKWLVGLTRGARPAEQVSALLMRPDLPPGGIARLRGLVKRAVVRRARRLDWLTLYRLDLFVDRTPRGDGLSSLPDPVELGRRDEGLEAAIRAEHSIEARQRVVLLIGELSERKSVPEVLDAWSTVTAPDARLALVGQLSPGVRAAAERAAATDPRVVLLDAYASDDEFQAWLGLADLVVVLHKNVGSSGVALKCWAMGVPVLAPSGSELAEGLLRAGATVLAAPADPGGLASVIDEFVSGASEGERGGTSTPALAERMDAFTHALLGVSDAGPGRRT